MLDHKRITMNQNSNQNWTDPPNNQNSAYHWINPSNRPRNWSNQNDIGEIENMIFNIGKMVFEQNKTIKGIVKTLENMDKNINAVNENIKLNNNMSTAVVTSVLGKNFESSKELSSQCEQLHETIKKLTNEIETNNSE